MLDFRKAAALLPVAVLLFSLESAFSADPLAGRIGNAEDAFKKAVTAWKEERFHDLYEQGSRPSRRFVSKTEFVRLMKNSHVRLQCCFSAVQAVREIAGSDSNRYLTATLGYEFFSPAASPPGKPQVNRWVATAAAKEDTFLLLREEGGWRIDLSDVLAAGGYLFAYPPLDYDRPDSLSFNQPIH